MTGVDTPDHAWHQAQLSLRRDGLGLRSLAHHSPAAYMASLSNSNSATSNHCHLASAIAQYNTFVPLSDALTVNDFVHVDHILSQRQLSHRLEHVQLTNLFDAASCADKARLLSTSSPHASAWLTVVPSDSFSLHLQPHLFQTAIRWWLGISHTASPEGNPLLSISSTKRVICIHNIICISQRNKTNCPIFYHIFSIAHFYVLVY